MSTIAECAPAPTEEAAVAKLVQADRCDRCSAQALIRVRMPSGSLLDFCGHHYRAHEPALAGQGAEIVDNVPAHGGGR